MNFMFNITGANTPLIKEYDIASDTEVYAGELVSIENSLVIKAEDGKDVLGVCAEDHTGKADLLNARADGTKIRVNITDGAVYSAKAPEYTAKAGCTATTLVTASNGLSVSVKSGFAVLVSKADGSTNTDAVGTKRRISAVAVTGETAEVTLTDGGVPCEGDTYMIIPDIGDILYSDTENSGVCFFNSAAAASFKCVCTDEKTGFVGVKLTETVFA